MKEWIAKYQKAIVGTGAVSVLLICYFQQKELAELRTKVQTFESVSPTSGDILRDSLESELFNAKSINGRYELSLEHLYEVDPKAGKEFTNFMENETE